MAGQAIPHFHTMTKITITREDMRRAKMGSANECAVALAIIRGTGAQWVSVGLDNADMCFDGRYRWDVSLPKKVQRRIAKLMFMPPFLRWCLKPMEFELLDGK